MRIVCNRQRKRRFDSSTNNVLRVMFSHVPFWSSTHVCFALAGCMHCSIEDRRVLVSLCWVRKWNQLMRSSQNLLQLSATRTLDLFRFVHLQLSNAEIECVRLQDVFSDHTMFAKRLAGRSAVGHTRYCTAGSSTMTANIQVLIRISFFFLYRNEFWFANWYFIDACFL